MLPAGEARDGGAELVLEVLDGVEPMREGGREVGQESIYIYIYIYIYYIICNK